MKKVCILTWSCILLIMTSTSAVSAQDFWQQTGLTNTLVRALIINPTTRDIFAGMEDGGLFRSTNNGDSWTAVNTDLIHTSVYALAINSSGHIFAGTNGDGLFRSTNNGGSWTAVNTGLIHTSVYGALAINSSGHIFAGTFDGGVFRSTNSGDSWTEVNTGLIITDYYAFVFNSSGHIFAAADGGVFHSTNNGDSWTKVNTGLIHTSVYALAINSSGHIFAGTDGAVYRSTNNGDSWSAVKTGLTNTLAINASGEIFAGTVDGGVFRSTNNGDSWTAVNTGLTNTIVFALAINTSGDIFAGTYGGGVFRSVQSTISGQPDLTPIRVGGQWRADLSFAPSSRGDDWVTITSTVRNTGNASASNVEVQLYDGNPSSGGTLINANNSGNPNIIAQIPANSSGTISVDWQPGTTGGKNGIFVVVDPQNLIAEVDESNNTGTYYKPPVILVAGIGGSPLYDSPTDPINNNQKVWIRPIAGGDSDIRKLRLLADGRTPEDPNVMIKVGPRQDGIATEVTEYPLQDTFQGLVNNLTSSQGFNLDDSDGLIEKDENLFLFLYDWRLSCIDAANHLASLVDTVMQNTDAEAVDIVAHSMGGLVVKSAILQNPALKESIRQLFFIGTPHLGAPKAFNVLKTGEFLPAYLWRFSLEEIREVAEHAPGLYQLLPIEKYFIDFIPYGPEYQVYKSYITNIGFRLNYFQSRNLIAADPNLSQNVLEQAEAFMQGLEDMSFGTIQIRNIVGYNKPTIGNIEHLYNFPKNTYDWVECENVKGDGTVPLRSAERYDNPTSFGKAHYYIKGVEHKDLPSSDPGKLLMAQLLGWYTDTAVPVHSQITAPNDISVDPIARYIQETLKIQFITSNNTPANSAAFSSRRTTAAFAKILPDTTVIEVANSQGQRISVFQSYSFNNEISDSKVEIFGIPDRTLSINITLPRNGNYQINYKTPAAVSKVYLSLLETKAGILESKLNYDTLAVVQNSNLEFILQPEAKSVQINADLDGNGQLETPLLPNLRQSSRIVSFKPMGWHLFSPPVDISYASVADFFNGIASAGVAYYWNNSAYVLTDTFKVGRGYWLAIQTEETLNFASTAVDSLHKHFLPGWHLIGGTTDSVGFFSPNDTPDGAIIATFGWDPISESYYPATTLEPGKGYWIAVAQECDLTIGGTTIVASHKTTTAMAWREFAEKFGELPPPPPNQFPPEEGQPRVPNEFALSQNYPNPFNPETVVEYQLPKAGLVSLKIYDLAGREVRALVNEEKPPGYYRVAWDGYDDKGKRLKSGVYLYRIQVGEFVATRKSLLLK